MHRAVKLALSRGDFDIVCCDNGSDALRICRESVPSLLIADLDLPGISGAELVKLVKQEVSLENTKIIMLCSSVHQSDIGRLDRIPADARLWKPFESDALFTLVHTLLRGASSHRSPTAFSSASTQQIQRKNLTDKPLERGFEGDATRPITKPSTLVDRTMPPTDPTSSPTRLQPFEGEATQRISSKEAAQNLWTPDYEIPTSDPTEALKTQKISITNPPSREPDRTAPVKQPIAPPAPPSSPTKNLDVSTITQEALSIYREAQSEWEVLGKRSHSPTPPPPPSTSSIQAQAPSNQSNASSPQITRDDIRNMIRAEIQMTFETWFKEKLDAKLQEILSQIESESKKAP